MLAAGAGLAYKNRDKIAGMVKGKRGNDAPLTTTDTVPASNSTGTADTIGTTDPMGTTPITPNDQRP
jgi:hypothetical protein